MPASFRRRRWFGWLGNLLLVAGSSVFALFVAEVVLRVYAPYLAGSHQHPSDISRDELEEKRGALAYDELLGWKFNPNLRVSHQEWEFQVVLRTNSRGLRDEEVSYDRRDRRTRIVLLGDSFGMGYGVEEEYSFPARLEKKLPDVEVINLSVSAYGTDQELLLYRTEGRKYDADVVMMALTVSNDFADIMKPRSYVFYKPYFDIDGGTLTLRGVPPPEPGRRDGSAWSAGNFASPTPVHDFLDRHSALYALVFERLSGFDAVRRRFEAMQLLYPQIDVYSLDQVGILSKTPSSQQAKAWALMLALIEAWRTDVVADGRLPVLVLIPSQLQVSPETWSRVAAKYHLSPEQFDPSFPNERLESYGAERDLEVIDLLPAFRERSRSGRSLYFRRDPHWNRYGHESAADRIAAELRHLGIVTK